VESISGLKFRAALALLASGRPAAAFALHASFGACLVAVAAALTVGLAPAAAGSGIAEVKAYLNGVDVPGIFDPPTLLVKLVGSVLAVAGGLAVGKEGPFVHAGAAVGALLSQGGPAGAAPAWFRANFWNARDRADMVAVGTAAGIAAAFRAPLGGLLFALEEATTWWRNHLLWYGFFTTAVVSVAGAYFVGGAGRVFRRWGPLAVSCSYGSLPPVHAPKHTTNHHLPNPTNAKSARSRARAPPARAAACLAPAAAR
jgi:chloride channel 7